MFFFFAGENKFEVSDRFGNIFLRAVEDSNCCARQCCDQLRPFQIEIKDKVGHDLIVVRRPLRYVYGSIYTWHTIHKIL